MQRISISFFGFIDHGSNRRTVSLYLNEHWKGGGNMIASLLYKQIIEYKTAGGTASYLYLQGDNSWKETKNTTIF